MLLPLDFLIDVSRALKMQEQILIPSIDKLRSALAGHRSLQRAVCAQPESCYLLAPSNLFSGQGSASHMHEMQTKLHFVPRLGRILLEPE